MKVELFAHNRWSGRYRAALVFEGGRAIPGLSAAESKRLLGAAGDEGFGGRFKQVCVVRTGRGRQRMVLVGLGRRQDFEPDRVRAAVALTVNLWPSFFQFLPSVFSLMNSYFKLKKASFLKSQIQLK